MYLFVVAVHVLLCLILVLVILLQPGKGADVGAAFGGGGTSTVFGPRGPANLLQRATTVVAVLFMVTSISLSLYSSRANMQDIDVKGAVRELQSEKKGKPESESTPTPEAPPSEDDGAP